MLIGFLAFLLNLVFKLFIEFLFYAKLLFRNFAAGFKFCIFTFKIIAAGFEHNVVLAHFVIGVHKLVKAFFAVLNFNFKVGHLSGKICCLRIGFFLLLRMFCVE